MRGSYVVCTVMLPDAELSPLVTIFRHDEANKKYVSRICDSVLEIIANKKLGMK